MGANWIEPVRLDGNVVRLEPLGAQHAAALARVVTLEILRYHFTLPQTWDEAGLAAYIEALYRLPTYVPFAQVLQESGQAIGISCYLDVRPAHRGLEIGSTWLGTEYQGTQVNPEAKYLLLRHAFETLHALRVQLKTDGRNIQSQRAIAKLGAQLEGNLRKYIIMPDGYLRDTIMFSILEEEWPAVKSGLEARLGYVPGDAAPEFNTEPQWETGDGGRGTGDGDEPTAESGKRKAESPS